MDHRTVATARARPLRLTDRERIVDYTDGGQETSGVLCLIRDLRVASKVHKRLVNDVVREARDPAIAAQRLLLAACGERNQPLVEMLLPMCDVNAVGQSGETAIIRAARGGRLAIVRLLLDQGAKLNHNDSYTEILRSALAGGNAAIVELVLENAGDRVDVSEVLGNCRLQFQNAVANDRLEFVSLLLAYGASVQSEGNMARTRLACSVRSVAMAKLLEAHGFDFGGEPGLQALVETICQGNTPLMKYYIEIGVDLRRLRYRTASPLHTATIIRRLDLIQLFAAQCIDLDARLEDGTTALQQCFTGGEDARRAHQLLVDLGADVSARSDAGVDSRYRVPPPWKEPIDIDALWASKENRDHTLPTPPRGADDGGFARQIRERLQSDQARNGRVLGVHP